MSSKSITTKLVRGPARVVLFILRAIRAAIVLVVVGILWLALFVLFLPFLVLSELLGWKPAHQCSDEDAAGIAGFNFPASPALCSVNGERDDQFVFDRRKDVPKLIGCNTRNVQYRWSLFARRIVEIKNRFKEPHALDFGAGSLRDSYELARQGFRVISMDLDEDILKRYFESYDWTELSSSPHLFVGSFEELSDLTGQRPFQLALSFDVIEHLENPEDYLRQLRPLLDDKGYLFTIIPNRRTVLERYFKHNLEKQRRHGWPLKPGVPHLQFRSPEEWVQFLEASGFGIVEHDMTLGFLVNDVWNGALGLPIYLYVTPMLHVLRSRLGFSFDPTILERAVAPAWLMKRIDVLDGWLKKWLRVRFGWNLIVAQKRAVPR